MEYGFSQLPLLVNTMLKLIAGWMIFFMHSGWAMLETGSICYESIPGVLAKNVAALVVGFVCWWILGHSLAYRMGSPFLGDASGAFDVMDLTWFVQGTFCASAATIASGAVAERMGVEPFAIYVFVFALLTYPMAVHWCWSGNGFLSYLDDAGSRRSFLGAPFEDFAGSGVVHITGGIGALLGAIAVGPRPNRFRTPALFFPHNISLVVLGTFVMWFCWFGFNVGSIPSFLDSNATETAVLVTANTAIGPAVSGLVVHAFHFRCASASLKVVRVCNGILAGLVATSGPCGFVDTWAAALICGMSALIYLLTSRLMEWLKVDDPLDAFAVHGVCGVWGVLATGIFSKGNGVLFGGDQILVQLVGAVSLGLWSAVTLAFPLYFASRVNTEWSDSRFTFALDGPEMAIPDFPRQASPDSPRIATPDSPRISTPRVSTPEKEYMANISVESESIEEGMLRLAGRVDNIMRTLGIINLMSTMPSSRRLSNLEKRLSSLEGMMKNFVINPNSEVHCDPISSVLNAAIPTVEIGRKRKGTT